MNPKEELSPEEKLLRLIRHSDKKPPKSKQTADVSSSYGEQKLSPHSLSVNSNKSQFKKNIVFSSFKSLNFILINRLIFLAIFVSVLFFVLDLYFNQPKIINVTALTTKHNIFSSSDKELKPFSYYQEEIFKHNLFKLGGEQRESRTIPTGSTFNELIKNFSLLGIVSGSNPKVIIEDKKSNKTYFLYAGDFLGDIKIEEIYPDRVVLEFRGERISLFL